MKYAKMFGINTLMGAFSGEDVARRGYAGLMGGHSFVSDALGTVTDFAYGWPLMKVGAVAGFLKGVFEFVNEEKENMRPLTKFDYLMWKMKCGKNPRLPSHVQDVSRHPAACEWVEHVQFASDQYVPAKCSGKKITVSGGPLLRDYAGVGTEWTPMKNTDGTFKSSLSNAKIKKMVRIVANRKNASNFYLQNSTYDTSKNKAQRKAIPEFQEWNIL